MKRIEKEIAIEELIELLPKSVAFLREKGIRCIACGEPIWGSLEQAAQDKGFSQDQIQVLVEELNTLIEKHK
jgi:methionine synthase II (cobalamin-independent)